MTTKVLCAVDGSEHAEAALMTAAEIAAQGLSVADTAIIKDRAASTGIVHHAILLGSGHIVIGTGDQRGLERLIPGSVAKDVAAGVPRNDRRVMLLPFTPHSRRDAPGAAASSCWFAQRLAP